MRAEQEHIARQTLHREVFIERADRLSFRFRDDGVSRILRNRAAGRDRGESRSAPAPNSAVHLIAVQHGPATPARRGDAFRQHLDHCVEGCRGPDSGTDMRFATSAYRSSSRQVFRGCFRNDLLRENIEGVLRNRDVLEVARIGLP